MKRKDPMTTNPIHPAPPAWLAWALGALGAETARELERHAHRCEPCRALGEAGRVLARAAQPGMFERVPRAARRRSEAAFASAAPAPRRREPTGLGRLRVVWSPAFAADTGFVLAAGMRGVSAERRCTLEAGGHRVDLEWLPEGSAWKLRGRVASAPGLASPRVLLELTPGGAKRVTPGPRGFFGPLSVARPELRVRLETPSRSFRSPWVPAAPRARAASPRKARP